MDNLVEINVVEDDSVKRVIEKTAKKLENKYSKKRKINERILNHDDKKINVFSSIVNIICGLFIFFVVLVFLCIVFCKIQNIVPSFAGFSSMRVATPSMVASGFNVGNNVIVRAVNTDTLKEGDIIAFYYYFPSSVSIDEEDSSLVDTSNIKNTQYTLSFSNFFGIQNDSIKTAAKSGSSIVFHHIAEVYECNGTRWFKTYGSSNVEDWSNPELYYDSWKISEEYVVGIYDNSAVASFFAGIINGLSSSMGIFLAILIPFVIMGSFIALQFLKDIQILKLQLDVIEEKRKITDDICIRNNVGFSMDLKSKYKVLAQADDEHKNEYISLLWKDGTSPESIRKYCLRKKMYLKPVEDLLNINRICEQRIENGENPEKVVKFYIKEKEKLQQAQLEYERRFRSWIKNKTPQDEIELLNDEKKNDTEINDNETNAKKGSKNGNSNSIKRKNKTNNKTRKR